MRRQFLIASLLFFGLSAGGRATVGGSQTIEPLGFDLNSNELVFLRYYQDEYDHDTEMLPQLYRLSLAPNATPAKVDLPFYGARRKAKEKAHERYEYQENDAGFYAFIRDLKAHLATLTPATPVEHQVRILTHRPFIEHTSDGDVPAWEMVVAVTVDGLAGSGHVTNYCDRRVRLERWYSLPTPGLSVAIIAHTGVPEEGCYEAEDIVVLRRTLPQP